LFYTAYGDPICDCPLGQFPFPKRRDNCVSLFTRGPCRKGEIVNFNNATGALGCLPDKCVNIKRQQSIEAEETQLLPSADDGLCYPLRSSCSNGSSAIFDYDIFKMRPTCRVIKSSAANDDEADLNEIYNQLYPDYDFYRFILTYNNNRRNKLNRRLTGGELNYRRKLHSKTLSRP